MTDILVGNGTPIIFANSGDFNPTAGIALVGTRTHQINLTSLAAAAFRQSAKADLGATRAERWLCQLCIEPVSAPTIALSRAVEVFAAFSDSATAANNNPGNVSGSDAAYLGYGAAAADADEVIDAGQLPFIGRVGPSADDDIFIGDPMIFVPKLRYVSIVVRNGFNVALEGDAVEMSVWLTPLQGSF